MDRPFLNYTTSVKITKQESIFNKNRSTLVKTQNFGQNSVEIAIIFGK